MRSVRIKPEAASDVAAAAQWYDGQRPGLGAEFLDAFDTTLTRIDRFPDAQRLLSGGFRRALMTRFPYAVYVLLSPDVIVVYGVFHQRRSPQVVAKRLR